MALVRATRILYREVLPQEFNKSSPMNALVTGASAGIGKEMVYLLAQRGYHVVMVARREEVMETMAQELPRGGTVIAMDLSRPGAAQELYNECIKRELTIDVLVNNAGFGRIKPHTEIEVERLEQMNQLNVNCLSSLCRLFGQDMKKRREGCILNVGSVVGYLPQPFGANYAASKAFVVSLTRALRAELRPYGIQVSLLNPGPTETEFGKVAQDNGDFEKGKPQVMSAAEVAEIGITGLFADHAEVIPGAYNQAIPFLVKLLPKSWVIRAVDSWMRSRLGEE